MSAKFEMQEPLQQ